MKRKAMLGFVIVLVLTLVLAGLTFYKIAEIFGLHQTQKALNSFNELVVKVEDTASKPVGTKESMPLYVDKKSAIIGFSKDSTEVFVKVEYANDHKSPRPSECAAGKACLCLCREYDWSIERYPVKWDPIAIDIQPVRCKGEFICRSFDNFDFPSYLSDADLGTYVPGGHESYTGGFVFARTSISGSKQIKTRLKGVYVTKQTEDLMSISFNVEGISDESLKKHSETEIAKKLFNEAYTAYTRKEYDKAIEKFEELINKGIIEQLSTSEIEQVYLYRGTAYYHKGDYEKAVTALDEAISYVSDEMKASVRKLKEKAQEQI